MPQFFAAFVEAVDRLDEKELFGRAVKLVMDHRSGPCSCSRSPRGGGGGGGSRSVFRSRSRRKTTLTDFSDFLNFTKKSQISSPAAQRNGDRKRSKGKTTKRRCAKLVLMTKILTLFASSYTASLGIHFHKLIEGVNQLLKDFVEHGMAPRDGEIIIDGLHWTCQFTPSGTNAAAHQELRSKTFRMDLRRPYVQMAYDTEHQHFFVISGEGRAHSIFENTILIYDSFDRMNDLQRRPPIDRLLNRFALYHQVRISVRVKNYLVRLKYFSSTTVRPHFSDTTKTLY